MDKSEQLPKLRKIPQGVSQFVDVLKQIPEVNRIILFGSSVTGAYRETSDWDLGVICNGISAKDVDEYLRKKGITKEQVGELNIHAQVFTQEEIDRFERDGRATGHPMKGVMILNMLTNGIPL